MEKQKKENYNDINDKNRNIKKADDISSLTDKIDFSKLNGLIPAVAQDYYSKEILMLAFMDKEALQKTLETGYAHYFSRSRQKLWKKGETSGNVQKITDIFYDCDNDSILLKVIQTGVACHTGHRTCFYSKVGLASAAQPAVYIEKEEKAEKDKEIFYSLALIFDLIKSRKTADTKKSYVASLLSAGIEKIAKKLQEETLEVVLAGFLDDRERIIYEASDLLFFYMVFLVLFDIDLTDIVAELKKREGTSGIDEKNSR